MNEVNSKGKNKIIKIVIISMIILVSLAGILVFSGPTKKFFEKEIIKNFEIETLANMYVMVEITKEYISGEIDVVEFSKKQTKLTKEMDRVKLPNEIGIEGMVLSYTSSCEFVVLNALNSEVDGTNSVDAIDKSVDTMISTMNTLKDKIGILNKENEIDITFSADVQKEIDNLMVKIK